MSSDREKAFVAPEIVLLVRVACELAVLPLKLTTATPMLPPVMVLPLAVVLLWSTYRPS